MSETVSPHVAELPMAIGVAVTAHYFSDKMAGYALAQPDDPNQVLDVTHTVMNHTNLPPDEIAEYMPQIKELMTALYSSWSKV